MNSRFFTAFANAWQISTGYPIPFFKFGKERKLEDNYLSYFPLCGFIIGLVFYGIAKMFVIFSASAIGTAMNTLCAILLTLGEEAITHGEGLACLSVITGRHWPQLDKTLFCINQFRDFSIASVVFILLRFLSAVMLLQTNHAEFFLLIYTVCYCARIELGFAKTEFKLALFTVSENASKNARMWEIISFIAMLFLFAANGSFIVILFYLVAAPGIHFYIIAKQLRNGAIMTHARYQAISYGLETVLLLSAAIAFPTV